MAGRQRFEYGYGGTLQDNQPLKLHAFELGQARYLPGETLGVLLVLLLWQKLECGKLKDDDKHLARLLCLHPARWRKHRAGLEHFIRPHEEPGHIVFSLEHDLRLVSG